mmetsp:Transcript_33034/g.108503  ORF Transcript_33034/g.108503 Transcript_33034/m.108503 type:complete len:223 (-) Transcript_33034:621-1289(-)
MPGLLHSTVHLQVARLQREPDMGELPKLQLGQPLEAAQHLEGLAGVRNAEVELRDLDTLHFSRVPATRWPPEGGPSSTALTGFECAAQKKSCAWPSAASQWPARKIFSTASVYLSQGITTEPGVMVKVTTGVFFAAVEMPLDTATMNCSWSTERFGRSCISVEVVPPQRTATSAPRPLAMAMSTLSENSVTSLQPCVLQALDRPLKMVTGSDAMTRPEPPKL